MSRWPLALSDEKFVTKHFPRATCNQSGELYQIVSAWSAEDEHAVRFLQVQYLSGLSGGPLEAWKSAATRIRTIEGIRGKVRRNAKIVKALFPDAYCGSKGTGNFQIRRPKRAEDRGRTPYVPISSPFSEEALAWKDAASRVTNWKNRERSKILVSSL
jgi:hypothetical protein